mmetsp:Transcript_77411/g.205501  ORF Transcript_77411/g.205501 Transcript_77411/m.205501 type:complete len:393 (-) Transcript_77411:21-1199(-)
MDEPAGDLCHVAKLGEVREAAKVDLDAEVAVVVARLAHDRLAVEHRGSLVGGRQDVAVPGEDQLFLRRERGRAGPRPRGCLGAADLDPTARDQLEALLVRDRRAVILVHVQRLLLHHGVPAVLQGVAPLVAAEVLLHAAELHELVVRALEVQVDRRLAVDQLCQPRDRVLGVGPPLHAEPVAGHDGAGMQDSAHEARPAVGRAPLPHGAGRARVLDGRVGGVAVVHAEAAQAGARDLEAERPVLALQLVAQADRVRGEPVHEQLLAEGGVAVLPVVRDAGEVLLQVVVVPLAADEDGAVPGLPAHLLDVVAVPLPAVLQADGPDLLPQLRAAADKVHGLLRDALVRVALPDAEDPALRQRHRQARCDLGRQRPPGSAPGEGGRLTRPRSKMA